MRASVERVAVVGVGKLGSGFVESLLRAGFVVTAFDPDESARARARTQGAIEAASPREAAVGADVVVLAVPDEPHVFDALDGPDGVVAGIRLGVIVAITSTVAPAVAHAAAERVQPVGGDVVDAPVSGGPARARAGKLTIMVGGGARALDRIRPVLEALGEHVVNVGPLGHGLLAKLVNNLMGAVITLGVAEGLALAAKAGLELARTLPAIEHASGGSWILHEWVPETVLRGDYAPRFSVELMRKDLRLIGELAESLGVPVPAAELARATFNELSAGGYGNSDFSIVADARARAAGAVLAAGNAGVRA